MYHVRMEDGIDTQVGGTEVITLITGAFGKAIPSFDSREQTHQSSDDVLATTRHSALVLD